MSYHRSPIERPRQAKRFLTVRDVEDLAATGARQIVHSSDLVITDAAREAAIDLDIRIVADDGAQPVAAPRPVAAAAAAPSAIAHRPPQQAVHDIASVRATVVGEPVPRDAVRDDALVQAVVRAIRLRWRPVKRHTRQLTA